VRGRFVLLVADPDKHDGVSGRFACCTEGGNEGLDGVVTGDELEHIVFVACDGELGSEGGGDAVRGTACTMESIVAGSYNNIKSS
jgi:hypothetical protein